MDCGLSFTAYCLLLTAFCLLPSAFCFPLSAFCLYNVFVPLEGERESQSAVSRWTNCARRLPVSFALIIQEGSYSQRSLRTGRRGLWRRPLAWARLRRRALRCAA